VKARTATQADIPAILEMAKAFLESTDYGELLGTMDVARTTALAEALMGTPDGCLFVLERWDDRREDEAPQELVGMIAGFASAHIITGRIFAEEVAWWVDHDVRSQGGGALLIAAFEDWASGKGCAVVKLVSPNSAVGLFYTKKGYREVETAFVKNL
jgi:GNAT superfamily N-acetyltransferase